MSNASSASLFAATQAIDDAWSKLVQQLQAVAMTVVNTPNTLDLASKALLGVTTDTNLRADEQNWAARVQDLRNESSSLGSRVQQLQMDGRQQSQDHTARIVVSTNKTLEAFLKLAVALRGKVFPNSNPESAPKDIIERLLEIQAKARAGTRATSEGYLALSKLSEQAIDFRGTSIAEHAKKINQLIGDAQGERSRSEGELGVIQNDLEFQQRQLQGDIDTLGESQRKLQQNEADLHAWEEARKWSWFFPFLGLALLAADGIGNITENQRKSVVEAKQRVVDQTNQVIRVQSQIEQLKIRIAMLNTILETLSQARTNFGGLIRESDAIILQSQVGEKLLGDLKVDMRNIMASTESMLGTANSADYAQNKVQYWEYILDAAKASLFCKDAVGGVQAILMKMSDDGDEEVMESQSIRQKIGEITDAMRKWQ